FQRSECLFYTDNSLATVERVRACSYAISERGHMHMTIGTTRLYRNAGIVGLALVAIPSGHAIAGGFGVEQSAYYQGLSFAGAAAGGGPSLASISWNPATSSSFGPGLNIESSYSVVLMSAGITVSNPQDQLTAGPAETE